LGGRWDERLSGLALQLHPPEALPAAVAALNNLDLGTTPRKAALDVIDAIGTEETGRLLVGLVESPDTAPPIFAYALHHLSRNAGQDWRNVTGDRAMDEALDGALDKPDRNKPVWKFLSDTQRPSFAPYLIARAKRSDLPLNSRLASLRMVKTIAPKISPQEAEGMVKELSTLLHAAEPVMRGTSLEAIQHSRGSASRRILLALVLDTGQELPFRANLAKNLARTQSGAIALLNAVEQETLPADLLPVVSEQIHNGPFEDARMMAEQLLPRDTAADGKTLPPMEELVVMAGDPVKGKAIFFSEELAQCYRCHRIGEAGNEVGPNLTVIGEKFGREGILEAILYPSAAISQEYEVWILETEWDGFLSGFIVSENDDEIQFMDATGTVKALNKEDIIDRRRSTTSLMPTGLAETMSAQDLSDLVAYLATLK
ncbi:MAG: c-type cytochrome, partial [Candidatus Hydrogenedentes bacterium]|nr:c-type cytochrome [Candidatus Hydrogenedentota bacterium]